MKRAQKWQPTLDAMPTLERTRREEVLDNIDKLYVAYDLLIKNLQESNGVGGQELPQPESVKHWRPVKGLPPENQHWGQGNWGWIGFFGIRYALLVNRPIDQWTDIHDKLKNHLIGEFRSFQFELPPELR